MGDNVLVFVEGTIYAGQLDNLKALISEMVEAFKRDELGTLNYEWFLADDGKSVHVYERYADSEAYVGHLRSFGETYAERCFTQMTVTKLAIYGHPSDMVREVLANSAPIYMSPYDGIAR